MPYYVFFDGDGRIETRMFLAREADAIAQDRPFVESSSGVSGETHYVKDGAVLDKSPYSFDMVTEGLVVYLTGLPENSLVKAGGSSVLTDDQPTEVEFELPGTYTIKLSGLVEYRDETLEVTVG